PRAASRATPPWRLRRSRPSVGVNRTRLDRLLAEDRLEDLECGRGGRISTVPAVLDQRADDEPRCIRGPVAAPPRLVERAGVAVAGVDDLLGRSGLAGDRDGEAAEDGRGRAEGVV